MTIDMIVKGLERGSGRSKDRLQLRVEAAKKASREAMLRELASRVGGLDLLRALYDHRIDLEELYQAYIRGSDALAELLKRKQVPPLSQLMDDYVTSLRSKTKGHTEKYLARFRASLDDDAELGDVTAGAVEAWLAEMRSQKHKDRRAVSAQTKNRALMAVKGFGTWCVERGYCLQHPLKHVEPYLEDVRRIRYLTPAEYHAYFAALQEDRPALTLPFKVLMHTGADLGEVVVTKLADGRPSSPLLVRDLHFERELPRVLFKRTKVKTSPERLVPIPADLAAQLTAYVEERGLHLGDPLFGDVTAAQMRYAHQRVRHAIHRDDLRRKDLRHVAAVLWRWAGVDLDRIREWLGHSSIMQTVIYAAFGPLDSFDKPAIERVEAILAPKAPEIVVPVPAPAPEPELVTTCWAREAA